MQIARLSWRLAAVAWLALVVAACDGGGVEGSGIEGSKTALVRAPFDRVSVSGMFTTRIAVGERDSVVVTGDDNIVELVHVDVRDSVLEVSLSEREIDPTMDIEVRVVASMLNAVTSKGIGDITIGGVNTERFSITSKGAGSITAAGRATITDIRLLGAGEIDTRSLISKGVSVDLRGAGDIETYAEDALAVEIRGVGSVTCWGDPEEVAQDIKGIGEVSFR